MLKRLPASTGKAVLRRIGKRALTPMMEDARSNAPVEEGDLRDAIMISEKRTRRVKRFNNFDRTTGIELAMGPVTGGGVLNYAALVEFGTVLAPPKPYMRPAWYAGKEALLESIRDNLSVEIVKATSRYNKKMARLS
jgi:HK97 gp10 family phage protein